MPDQLTVADVAAAAGIEVRSVHTYMLRGTIPPPDGRLGRTPWWHRSTIELWLEERPGRGWKAGRPRKVIT